MTTHPQSTTCTETCGPQADQEEGVSREILPSDTNEDRSASEADQTYVTTVPVRKSVDWSDSVDDQQTEQRPVRTPPVIPHNSEQRLTRMFLYMKSDVV